MEKRRLDVILSETHFTSRSAAQDAIKEGRVSVNGRNITKPSEKLSEEDHIEVLEKEHAFASRAGNKLYDAIQTCNIDLKEKVVLDVGASTGGFTDVCLSLGASYVYAVDSGKEQLIERLRQDPRVNNMESTNARYLTKDMFDKKIDFVCMDVSFISIRLLLNAILECMTPPFSCLFLIKPQFEAGKQYIGKHGIVKDKKVHKRVLDEYIAYFKEKGLGIEHVLRSSVVGRDGNQEYLIHLTSTPNNTVFDTLKVVSGKGK